MALKFEIDAAKLASEFKEFAMEVEQDLKKAVGNLAVMTHAYVVDAAQQELHSSRDKFLDSLSFEEIAEGVWVVSVDEKGLWVEEGIEPNKDMKPDLLKNNPKISKTGNKYKVIPFDWSKPSTQLTPKTQEFVNYLKQSLKKEKVPFRKIEKNADGSAKVGKLHEFNFGNPGGKLGGPGKGTTPIFNKLTIYQTVTKTGNVRRDIMTFRSVSSGSGSEGKWIHPGLEPHRFLDKALEFAERIFDQEILPEIFKKWE